jgi:ATP-dependent protease HslVU (ClpYQ) ATPase subunit
LDTEGEELVLKNQPYRRFLHSATVNEQMENIGAEGSHTVRKNSCEISFDAPDLLGEKGLLLTAIMTGKNL